ncbi:hypothetical protein [Rhizorhabdus sp.]|uniref:hypothetical protein n=1 Tax=Rhizorhabdus sp. TaxID=1968843 RepID=UPI0035B4ABF9
MTDYPTSITGLPSGRKILVRLRDVLDLAAAELPEDHAVHGTTFVIDRSFEEPFSEAESLAGAVAIRLVDTTRTAWDHTTLLHRGEVKFDIGVAENGVNSIGDRAAHIDAWMINVLHADITLGGIAKDLESKSLTADEQQGAEAGIALSALAVSWLTPRTDLFTIIGPFGPIS